jgi:hypothetical protein
MSAPEARAAATRLETILARRSPLTATLEAEKWGTQSGLHHEFETKSVVAVANELQPEMSEGEGGRLPISERIALSFAALRTPKAQVMANHAHYMDEIIAQVAQPYAPHPPIPAEPTDVINHLITPVFTQARHKETDTQTQNALLLGKLALRAYHEEHGDYPQSLPELVTGGYLKGVPADPFARNREDGQFRYRRVSDSAYILYSVGPDGVDDGGRPIVNRYDDGREKRWTEQDSKGDFVLGVNLY